MARYALRPRAVAVSFFVVCACEQAGPAAEPDSEAAEVADAAGAEAVETGDAVAESAAPDAPLASADAPIIIVRLPCGGACPTTGDTPCKRAVCDTKTDQCVLTALVDGAWCPNADPCTIQSTCKSGECVPGAASWCQCHADADCAAFDDGNACNGVLGCDKSKFPWLCAPKKGSVVTCEAADDPCATQVCNPKTGACEPKAQKDGKPCDDGDPCTAPDLCAKGQCAPGKNNTCACQQDADCDDKNPCNGISYCDKASGKCAVNPKTVVVCPPLPASQGPCVVNAGDRPVRRQGGASGDGMRRRQPVHARRVPGRPVRVGRQHVCVQGRRRLQGLRRRRPLQRRAVL